MKPLLFSLTFLFACAFLQACCKGESAPTKGDITEHEFNWCNGIRGRELVIKDSAAYDSIKRELGNWRDESGSQSICQLPDIDFNKHTLLVDFSVGDCKSSFSRIVSRDDTNKQYVFSIYERRCGRCFSEVGVMRYFAVLVPRLPDDYTVLFKKVGY